MNSRQRKYLRGLAHQVKPVIYIGKGGVTAEILKATDIALDDHELIKIKFIENKGSKAELTDMVCQKTTCELAGIIGHIAILYRPSRNPSKRKIKIPVSDG